jgi:hypothetical protein
MLLILSSQDSAGSGPSSRQFMNFFFLGVIAGSVDVGG